MLNNFWYACEFSHAVTHQPKQIVLWQQTIVLYRNSAGRVIELHVAGDALAIAYRQLRKKYLDMGYK